MMAIPSPRSIDIELVKKLLTWITPAIGIPALRYSQDTQAQRRELFIRDASTYTVGALLFLGTERAMQAILEKTALCKTSKEIGALLIALTANITYAGIGAIHLSRWLTQKQKMVNLPTSPSPLSSPKSIATLSEKRPLSEYPTRFLATSAYPQNVSPVRIFSR